MNDDDFVQEVADKVEELVRYVQAAERFRAMLTMLTPLLTEIEQLAELDEELTPELRAVVDHLIEAGEALQRGFAFASARMNVNLAVRWLNGEEEPS